MTPSRVALVAEELGLSVVKSNRLGPEVTEQLLAYEPEVGVIVAYGGLLREPLLSGPTHGWINLHFSLLPAWRGAAPVQRSLMAGDSVGGVTVFRLVAELDAGEILVQDTEVINPNATAGDVLAHFAVAGADTVLRALSGLNEGTLVPEMQKGDSSYAHKLTLDDARLDWQEPAERVYNRYRGVTPEPGAFTVVGGQRLKVAALLPLDKAIAAVNVPPGHIILHDGQLIVGTGTTPLVLLHVQPAGKREMAATDWFRGLREETVVTE
ncbi:methionyl-tRNA formyltransferase [Klugiella xanthotipulae]